MYAELTKAQIMCRPIKCIQDDRESHSIDLKHSLVDDEIKENLKKKTSIFSVNIHFRTIDLKSMSVRS